MGTELNVAGTGNKRHHRDHRAQRALCLLVPGPVCSSLKGTQKRQSTKTFSGHSCLARLLLYPLFLALETPEPGVQLGLLEER